MESGVPLSTKYLYERPEAVSTTVTADSLRDEQMLVVWTSRSPTPFHPLAHCSFQPI